jgi:hypothetical protein
MRTQVFANLNRELDSPAVELDLVQPLLTARSVTSEQLGADNAQACFDNTTILCEVRVEFRFGAGFTLL